MVVLVATALAFAGCADGCESVRVGCYEYLSAECAADVFLCWSEIPYGERPAHCVGDECLPVEWAECEVVRRLSPDCEC